MREQGTKIEVNSKDDWKKYSKFRTGKYTRVTPLTIEEINFLVNIVIVVLTLKNIYVKSF